MYSSRQVWQAISIERTFFWHGMNTLKATAVCVHYDTVRKEGRPKKVCRTPRYPSNNSPRYCAENIQATAPPSFELAHHTHSRICEEHQTINLNEPFAATVQWSWLTAKLLCALTAAVHGCNTAKSQAVPAVIVTTSKISARLDQPLNWSWVCLRACASCGECVGHIRLISGLQPIRCLKSVQ